MKKILIRGKVCPIILLFDKHIFDKITLSQGNCECTARRGSVVWIINILNMPRRNDDMRYLCMISISIAFPPLGLKEDLKIKGIRSFI